MILNEIERAVICGKQKYRTNADFIDAIEAAVLTKLSQGVSVEPVAWRNPVDSYSLVTTRQKETNEFQYSDEFLAGHTEPLYTAAAIAAARVAENERCANWLDERGASAGGQDLDPYRLAIGIRALKGGAA